MCSGALEERFFMKERGDTEGCLTVTVKFCGSFVIVSSAFGRFLVTSYKKMALVKCQGAGQRRIVFQNAGPVINVRHFLCTLSRQMALVTCLRACPLAQDATKQVWQHGCLPLFVGFIPSHSGAMWLLLTYLLFLFHIFLIFINFGNEIDQLLGMGKVSFEG
jgi:hypothetical protein